MDFKFINMNQKDDSTSPDTQLKKHKLDPVSKLHIIHAIDNGQTRVDLARDYGVIPQTIAYVYRQKELIMKRYKQNFNLFKEVRCVNLDLSLLSWLKTQILFGNAVTENQLRIKAEEIICNQSHENKSVDNEWLQNFKIRHCLSKFTPEAHWKGVKNEWLKLQQSVDVKNLYICSISPLAFSMDLDKYEKSKSIDKYLSIVFIVNCLGDKKQLAVVGDEALNVDITTKSIPVKYYFNEKPLVNNSILNSYLQKWDNEIQYEEKIHLVLNLPDPLVDNIELRNITILNNSKYMFLVKSLDKVIECFKYHYRRIQISKTIINGKEPQLNTLQDYFDTISAAWYCVPCTFIQRQLLPPPKNSLFFNEETNNLLEWGTSLSIPLNEKYNENSLQEFILCDNDLKCLSLDDVNFIEPEFKNITIQFTSGIEAYQAIKRLISYIQGQGADESILNIARNIENYLEYEALFEIQQTAINCNYD